MKYSIEATILFVLAMACISAVGQEMTGNGVIFPEIENYPSSPQVGEIIYHIGVTPPIWKYYTGSEWKALGINHSDRISDLQDEDSHVRVLEATQDTIEFNLDNTAAMRLFRTPQGDTRMELNLGSSNLLVGENAGRNNQGGSNLFMGEASGLQNTSGSNNLALGWIAGQKNMTGSRNTSVGRAAGYANTLSDNVYLGYNAGFFSDAGTRNTLIGASAGYYSEGSDNVFVGYKSGENGTLGGEENVAVGNYALQENGKSKSFVYDSRYNTAVGFNAGITNDIGSNNVFLGKDAGHDSESGSSNVMLGYLSGYDNASGSLNTYVGANAGQNNADGNYNVALGFSAGRQSSGINNTYLGTSAGQRNDGSNNVFIGWEAGRSEAGSPIEDVSNTLVISTDRDKALIYGEFDNNRVGINTTEPAGALHIGGIGNDSKLMLNNGGDIWWENSSGIFESVLTMYSDDRTYLHGPDGIILRTNGANTRIQIKDNGQVHISDLAGTGTADVQATSNGQLIRSTSDRRLKEDIKPIEHALQKILQMQGHSYYWKGRPHTDRTYGVIAQDVLEVVPDIVTTDGEYYGVNYSEIPAILIEAIKEQQGIIDRLEKNCNQALAEIRLLRTELSTNSE